MITLGIDVGGTGIKGAPVDTEKGVLLHERYRVLTPQPSTPQAVAAAVAEVAEHFQWKDRIGVGFPSVIKAGVVMTAANIDQGWVGTDGKSLLETVTRCKVNLINDADAAGIAEMRFGVGRGARGVVMMITVGTGIGTALFVDGTLVPNTELGHLEIRGKDAERRASDAVRQAKGLSWKRWAKRFDEYLGTVERLFWPDLIIIGGGGSKYFDRFSHHLTVRARIVPAKMLNDAGIVGAGIAGLHQPEPPQPIT
jgi:polyphosphate glucokinase